MCENKEKSIVEELKEKLVYKKTSVYAKSTAEEIQTAVYDVGKRHEYADLKAWFSTMYETLLGQKTGPRMGSFIALFGLKETVGLIDKALSGELAAKKN